MYLVCSYFISSDTNGTRENSVVNITFPMQNNKCVFLQTLMFNFAIPRYMTWQWNNRVVERRVMCVASIVMPRLIASSREQAKVKVCIDR